MSKYSRDKWRAKDPDLSYYRKRFSLLASMGGECELCKEKDVRCLQIDHRFGGGSDHRRTLNGSNPSRAVARHSDNRKQLLAAFRVLCANCHTKETYHLHDEVRALAEEIM